MRGRRAVWVLILLVLAGLFVGNRAGEALQAAVPALAGYGSLSMEPRHFTLLDLGLDFGISLRANAGGVLGAVLSLVLARRI